MGANRLLVVALGSAGRSFAQVSVSMAVFCDTLRTPRLRVLSLLRLCSDMLERAGGSEREREEGCGDFQVRGVQREREMYCKCSKYVYQRERKGARGGVWLFVK